MLYHYTTERNAQILLGALKEFGINQVIVSPGTTNIALVASMQSDSFFKMFSAPDERSAAYMACGIAQESGNPVVLTCTGATASRNYVSGLTEAFYRHLPILAVTSMHRFSNVGNLVAQVIDRSQIQKDIAKLSLEIPIVKDNDDVWSCTLKVNKALQALLTRGKGPVHINLETNDSKDFSLKRLPEFHAIKHVCMADTFPVLRAKKVAIFIGSHKIWTEDEQQAIDEFCSSQNAVVFCDHTSNYKGKYRITGSLIASQVHLDLGPITPDILIHIGEVSGDYATTQWLKRVKEVWRVSEDGAIRDLTHRLTYIFEMPEKIFFSHYIKENVGTGNDYWTMLHSLHAQLVQQMPESLPFTNIWIARFLSKLIPDNSSIHLGILNSLRSWNLFEIPSSVTESCNVGGFGIDGGMSSLIGASLVNPNKLYFGVFGDLAFFYDMNVLANRHVGKNVRILLINNGCGSEFRLYSHPASQFGEDANDFIAAAGHYGNQSRNLVKHYAQDLGYKYLSANNKEEFIQQSARFVDTHFSQSVIFEVFTEASNESKALMMIRNIIKPSAREQIRGKVASVVKSIINKK